MRDYSTHIVLENNLEVSLSLLSKLENDGSWNRNPMDTIAPRSASPQMQLRNSRDGNGSAGNVIYSFQLPSLESVQELEFSFACLPSGSNILNTRTTFPSLFDITQTVISEKPFIGKTRPLVEPPAAPANSPVISDPAKISISYKFLKTTCQVTRLTLRHPTAPVRNSRGEIIAFGEKIDIWSCSTRTTTIDNTTPGVRGSYTPVSVSSFFDIDIELDTDTGVADVPFTLTGEIDGEVVVSESNVFQDSEVTCVFKQKHDELPWGYAADIAWFLTFEPTNQKIHINSSRMEIYGIPKSLPSFFQKDGIPVEFLRHFVLPAPPGKSYPAWVANRCMNTQFNHQFDTYYGAPSFVNSPFGGSFKLDYWLKSVRPSEGINSIKVNCYDQAAVVQLAMSLQHGTTFKPWAFMEPFGYITTTKLLGWPTGCSEKCNNPFFNERESHMLLPINDRERGAFYNHAFYVSDSKVIDACCGPHTGTEDVPKYIKSAVDTSTTLYNHVGINPGTEADIRYFDGVTNLDPGVAVTDNELLALLSPEKAAALDQIMAKAFIPENQVNLFSTADITDLIPTLSRQVLHPKGTTRLHHQSTELGPQGSITRFIFTETGTTYTLTLNICLDHPTAVLALRQHLSAYQRPLEEIFSTETLQTDTSGGLHGLFIPGLGLWIWGSVFFILQSDAADEETLHMAIRIHEFFSEGCVGGANYTVPRIHAKSPVTYPVGTEFSIKPYIFIPSDWKLRWPPEMRAITETGNVLFLSLDTSREGEEEFRFLARGVGEDRVTLIVAHPESGVVGKMTVVVRVYGDE